MEESLKFEETVVEEKPKKNKREILSVIFLVLSLVCLMISGFNVNVYGEPFITRIFSMHLSVFSTKSVVILVYGIWMFINLISAGISVIGIVFYGIHLILRKEKISAIIMYGLVALIYVSNLLCAPLLRTVLMIIIQKSLNGYWTSLIFGLINLSILVVSLILALTMVLTAKTHKVIKILLIIFISLYLSVLLYKNNYGYMLESYNYHYYFHHFVNDPYYYSGAWLTKTLLFSNLFFFLVGDTLIFGITFIALGIETLIKNKGKAKLFSIAYFVPLVLVVVMLGSDILNFIYQVLIRLLMK